MTMKNVFLVFFMISITISTVAQQEEFENKEENLFENVSLNDISGFGALITQFSSIGNEFSVMSGFSGGVLFNQKLFIGGYGMGLASQYTIENPIDTLKNNLDFGQAGVIVGYNHNPHKLIHWTICSRMGWGNLGLYEEDNYDDLVINDRVFVLSPTVGAELNITKWFKLNTEIGYRVVTGIDKTEFYEENEFNSPIANVSLLFGGFSNK